MSVQLIRDGSQIKVYDNKLYSNNKPNIACLVILVRESDMKEIARTTTDRYGYYEFLLDNPSSGLYQVQFYGSRTVQKFAPDGDWEKFEIPVDMVADLNPLDYDTIPSMFIQESHSRIDVNKNEISIIQISFTDLIPIQGVLTRIEVYYKKADEASYSLFKSIPITHTDATHVEVCEVLLDEKPSFYDFKAILIDSLGSPYKESGVVQELKALNIKLDGVPDVNEYIAVIDIEPLNVNEDTMTLADDVLKVKFTDLKNLKPDAFPIETHDAFGRAYSLTYEVAKKIESYAAFLFIADQDTFPQDKYPGMVAMYGIPTYGQVQYAFKGATLNDPNGIWVFHGESATPTFEIKVPRDKYIGLWIGFRSATTVSKVETEKLVY